MSGASRFEINDKMLYYYVDTAAIKQGIGVVGPEGYQVSGFLLSLDAPCGDITEQFVDGDFASPQKYGILKNRRPGHVLSVLCVGLEKGQLRYNIEGFVIFIQ